MTDRERGPTDVGDGAERESNGASAGCWPIELRGVTETVVTTLGPNGRWNVAALGVFAPEADDGPARARTWGNTRTRRNFHRQGEGYVQFTHDALDFVHAALTITERTEPVLESAQAWTRVAVDAVDSGTSAGTDWEEWTLEPRESAVTDPTVTPINRGFGAVIEATVAASRLGIDGYDDAELEARLEHALAVVDRTGGATEREAMAVLIAESPWSPDDRS